MRRDKQQLGCTFGAIDFCLKSFQRAHNKCGSGLTYGQGYGATEVGPIAHNGRVNPNVEELCLQGCLACLVEALLVAF